MSTKSKEKVQMDPAYIIKLTVTLLVTCVVVAAALGGVNAVTEEKIDAINWANTVTAMKAVVADPDNTTFSDELPLTDEMIAAAGSVTLDSVYEAQVGGASAGYAIKVVASGSQGKIEMMVGVDGEGTVTGVSIVKNAETAGIGSKVMTNMPTASGVGVLSQFEGKSAADGILTVGANVDAISGATVSTRGVTNGVNAALAVAGVLG
ncbi:FMN-binding protein [uncultured Oscillibacter sp.]|jgi:electron transport complex protein RnfG|uniref:FMN-binding protein n=1 Tax=uncultured Oscillibacter sp. TaxID=876091 RepID=UPI0026071625|nr:FMN-binding protein [uncultured Oscillibacter sp.]